MEAGKDYAVPPATACPALARHAAKALLNPRHYYCREAKDLIGAAGGAPDGLPIHSIAFFTSGGGLPEIAEMSGGTYREVNGPEDLV